MRHSLVFAFFLFLSVGLLVAQLGPVPEPPENPITEQKRVLGKILFWDEQLSSDTTVACGTCHGLGQGGVDPRFGAHPGADGTFGNEDDVIGSPGVVSAASDGELIEDPVFGFDVQVTRRAANPAITAMFAPELFWDGRAPDTFINPETGLTSIVTGGALESQGVAPILSSVEMARSGRTWADAITKLETATPLYFGADLPADVSAAIDVNPTYPDLFADAFGDPAITAERIGFAIATYERTLVPDQTPWDLYIAGDVGAMTPSQADGWDFFSTSACSICHAPPEFTDHSFRNVGVRPVAEDTGRQEVTGEFSDRGKFKVPTLRNVALKPTVFHNGSLMSLQEVVEFYSGNNQNDTDNLDPILPIGIPITERAGFLDFIQNGLIDPRVADQTFPFDQPTLLQGQDPRPMLLFDSDRATLRWHAPQGALAYRIYRGDLADLTDSDEDGLADGGYGDCVTHLDPDDTDTVFVDAELPATGAGFFYLKAIVTAAGEQGIGTNGDGLPRIPATACP